MDLSSLKDLEKDDLKRYGIFIGGVILSLGFAFGAVVTFAGIVDTQPSGQQGEQVELPGENYQESSFDLDQRAQFQLAFQFDVAFVNAYYTDQEEKESMRNDLQDLPAEFNDRVFVQVVNESNRDSIAFSFAGEIEDYPAYIIVGGNQEEANRISDQGLMQRDEVVQDICTVMRDWSGLAQCQTL